MGQSTFQWKKLVFYQNFILGQTKLNVWLTRKDLNVASGDWGINETAVFKMSHRSPEFCRSFIHICLSIHYAFMNWKVKISLSPSLNVSLHPSLVSLSPLPTHISLPLRPSVSLITHPSLKYPLLTLSPPCPSPSLTLIYFLSRSLVCVSLSLPFARSH